MRTSLATVSGALGHRGRFRRPAADPPCERMPESHGDDPHQQMHRLYDPMAGARHQAELADTERRDDEAPHQNEEGESPRAAPEKPDDGEHPEADDEKPAESHVQLQQRLRVTGPEEDSERHESDAEEADEYACDENDRFHGRPPSRRKVRPEPAAGRSVARGY